MNQIVPPLCFVLSLLLVIAAFAVIARDQPQPSMEMHLAYLEDDEQRSEALELELSRKRLRRRVLIGSLFGLAATLIVTGYVLMRPPDP